jgi:hypothetical protein
VAGDELDEDAMRAVRRVAMEKMLHGATDAVQIQAAELVARLAGMIGPQGGVSVPGPYRSENGRRHSGEQRGSESVAERLDD